LNFSAVAASLHALTKSVFQWNPKAEKAFRRLKELFTTAPILTVPEPALQFMVEVGVGVGVVLSQRSATDNRIHPCAFLSCKLTLAERNYNVGNRELLAIKVALEEWCHWLEGAEQPFIVWTDYKNLEYLKSAKRLNSRQARGPQFISVFGKEFSHLLGATVSLSSGYHPESNGQTERLNQELETCLRCLVAQNQTTWSNHLTWVEYAQNALPTTATGLSPFHVVYGYQPPLFPANEKEVTVPSAHAMVKRCQKVWAVAQQMLLRGQARIKATADQCHRPAPASVPGK
ncbi:hypothetical protein L3Q82_014662, partial [Scortum barcoo]